MQPAINNPTLVRTLTGTGVQKKCTEISEAFSFNEWVKSADCSQLIGVRNSVTIYSEDGCIKAETNPTLSGETIPLCCSESCDSSSCDNPLEFAALCDLQSRRDSAYGGRIGSFHEIVSITPDKTTLRDGDILTTVMIWKLRADYPEPDVGRVCGSDIIIHCFTKEPDFPPYCVNAGARNGIGFLRKLTTDTESPECLEAGVEYTTTFTWLYTDPFCNSTGRGYGTDPKWVAMAFYVGVLGIGEHYNAPAAMIMQYTIDGAPFNITVGGVYQDLEACALLRVCPPYPTPFPCDRSCSTSDPSSSTGSSSTSGDPPSGSGSASGSSEPPLSSLPD